MAAGVRQKVILAKKVMDDTIKIILMVIFIPLGVCFICIIICIFAIYKSNKSPQRIVETQPVSPQYIQIKESDQSPYAQPSTFQTKIKLIMNNHKRISLLLFSRKIFFNLCKYKGNKNINE